MDILGIGIQEIIFILVIALIIFGPKDIVKAGQTAGRFLRKLITSPTWQAVQKTSRDLRNLPNKLIREAGFEETKNELDQFSDLAKPSEALAQMKDDIGEEMKSIGADFSSWTTSPKTEELPQETPQENLSPSQTSNDESEAS
jgi:Sec-independent protein translocase protein TatA